MKSDEKREVIRHFEKFLRKEGVSDNTIISYTWAVNNYYNQFESLSLTNLLSYNSFRHLYAKNFLAKYNNLALLVDLLGHTSIESTRVYLGYSSSEQHALINKIVTW